MALTERLTHLVVPLICLSADQDGLTVLAVMSDCLPEDKTTRIAIVRPLLEQNLEQILPELSLVADVLIGPLPDGIADKLVKSKKFADFIKDCANAENHRRHAFFDKLILLATLMPISAAPAFRSALDEIIDPDVFGAQLFTDFQLALEAEHPVP
jgi:hypothetical protein